MTPAKVSLSSEAYLTVAMLGVRLVICSRIAWLQERVKSHCAVGLSASEGTIVDERMRDVSAPDTGHIALRIGFRFICLGWEPELVFARRSLSEEATKIKAAQHCLFNRCIQGQGEGKIHVVDFQ